MSAVSLPSIKSYLTQVENSLALTRQAILVLESKYDRQTLEQLLRTGLLTPRRLDSYAADADTWPKTLRKVIEGADREDWLPELLEAAKSERSRDRALCRQIDAITRRSNNPKLVDDSAGL